MAGFRSLNKVTLIGNLGDVPQEKSTKSNVNFVTFSLATNEYWVKDGEKKQRTDWHSLTAWGKVAEDCVKYLKKGSLVHVEGSLRNREWEDKNGVSHKSSEIQAQRIVVLDPAKAKANEAPQVEVIIEDDDLPF